MSELIGSGPSYMDLLVHYDFSMGLYCLDRDPNEVDIDWIRENAFRLTPCKSDRRIRKSDEEIKKDLAEFERLDEIASQEFNDACDSYAYLIKALSVIRGYYKNCDFLARPIVLNDGGEREVTVELIGKGIVLTLKGRAVDESRAKINVYDRAKVLCDNVEEAVRFLASYAGDQNITFHTKRLGLRYEVYGLV